MGVLMDNDAGKISRRTRKVAIQNVRAPNLGQTVWTLRNPGRPLESSGEIFLYQGCHSFIMVQFNNFSRTSAVKQRIISAVTKTCLSRLPANWQQVDRKCYRQHRCNSSYRIWRLSEVSHSIPTTFNLPSVILLVGLQEEHPARNKMSDEVLAWLCLEQIANDLHMV